MKFILLGIICSLIGCAGTKKNNTELEILNYSFFTAEFSESDSLKLSILEKLFKDRFPNLSWEKEGIYLFFDYECDACSIENSFAFFDLSDKNKHAVTYCENSLVFDSLSRCSSIELEEELFSSFTLIPLTQMPKIIAQYGNRNSLTFSNSTSSINGYILDVEGNKQFFYFLNLNDCLGNWACIAKKQRVPVPYFLQDYVYIFDFMVYLSYQQYVFNNALPLNVTAPQPRKIKNQRMPYTFRPFSSDNEK